MSANKTIKKRLTVFLNTQLAKVKNNKTSHLVIRSNTTRISGFAFGYDNFLEEVYIPESVDFISYDAFFGCGNLKKIVVDENNKIYYSDEVGVLYSKDKKTLLFCPSRAEFDFYEIGNETVKIANYAFWCVDSLNKVVIENDSIVLEEHTFGNIIRDKYENYSLTSKTVIVPEFVKAAGEYAFNTGKPLHLTIKAK